MMAYRIKSKRSGLEIACDTAEEFREAVDKLLDRGDDFEALAQASNSPLDLSDTAKRFLRVLSTWEGTNVGESALKFHLELQEASEAGRPRPSREELIEKLELKSARGFGPLVGAVQRWLERVVPEIPFEEVIRRSEDDGTVYWWGGPRLAEVVALLDGNPQ